MRRVEVSPERAGARPGVFQPHSPTPPQGGSEWGDWPGTSTRSWDAPYPLTSIGIDLGLVSSRLGTCTVSTPFS